MGSDLYDDDDDDKDDEYNNNNNEDNDDAGISQDEVSMGSKEYGPQGDIDG